MTEPSAPRFPGLAGYRELMEASTRLELRHIADLFAEQQAPYGAETDPTGRARFLVLDGFRLARPGNRWRRIDGAALEQGRARIVERFGAAAGVADDLLDLLGSALGQDPDVARQLLLYQLARLASEPGLSAADTRTLLLDLGVHSGEADAVCAMIRSGPGSNPIVGAAAERVADAFADGRIFEAGECLRRIPRGRGRGDWRLERIEREVERRLGEAARLIELAGRSADQCRFEQASELYLQALTAAADEPRLRDGLVRAAIGIFDASLEPPWGPAPASTAGRLRATPVDEGIELVYARPHRPGEDRSGWTLLRLDCSTQRMRTLAEDRRSDAPFVDTGVRFGQEIRYIAIPYRNGLICGAASASGRIRHAPEVDGAVLRCTPRGVSLEWRLPPGLVGMSVLRSSMPGDGPGGVPGGVPGGSESVQIAAGAPAAAVEDLGVTPGVYQYLVQCGYPAPPGWTDVETVWSTGLALTAVVKPWPTPVDVLTAVLVAAQPPTLRISWLPPAVGTVRVVPWPFSPREPGSDITELAAELPPGLTAEQDDGSYHGATVAGRPGETLRLTAVSELGDRLLAGASVLIQVVRAPRGVSVQRVADASIPAAVIRFDWPEPAVLVSIRWEQDGRERRRVIPRTGYPPQGVQIPVGPSGCRVTVEPLGRPDAQVFSSLVSTVLPALPPPPEGALTRLRRRLRAAWRTTIRVLRRIVRRGLRPALRRTRE